jgi:hypothetical protein
MATRKLARFLIGGGIVSLLALTAAAYFVPLVPFRTTAVLLLSASTGFCIGRKV